MEKISIIALLLLLSSCTVTKKLNPDEDLAFFWQQDKPLKGYILVNSTYYGYTSYELKQNSWNSTIKNKRRIFLGYGKLETSVANVDNKHQRVHISVRR